MESPVVVAYGGGTNSKAMLIECVNRGINVDLILFADTGGEKPHTYEDITKFSKWLVENGMPEIISVRSPNETLEESLTRLNALPSIAYGFKTCSQRFKLAPQDKYINNWKPAKDAWRSGRKVTKLVGYDADESHRIKNYNDDKYIVKYPLVEWDYGRDECVEIIKNAELPLPGKSACFFCPSSRPSEIRQLAEIYPDLAKRALEMEANADLTHIKGLGRNYAWKDVLATSDMFSNEFWGTPEIDCGCYDGYPDDEN